MPRTFRTALATAAVVAVTGGLLTAVSAAPAAAAPAKYADDFDGDGHRDLAIGMPLKDIGDLYSAGAVTVAFGSSTGLTTRRIGLNQNSTGVPGAPEEYDRFGASITGGDLDGDGYADLVVTSSGEDVGEYEDIGSVTILWGGAKPFTTSTTTVVADPRDLKGHGHDLAVGDFTGGEGLELAVMEPGRVALYPGSQLRTGRPSPIRILAPDPYFGLDDIAVADINNDGKDDLAMTGGPGLFDPPATEIFLGGTDGPTSHQRLADGGDTAAVLGDINGDGYDDLATSLSRPDTDLEVDPSAGAGFVTVRYAGPTGFGAPVVLHQDTAGVPGGNEATDEWGSSLAIGDITGDGRAELVVGARGEDLGSIADAGDVTVFRGTAAGLSTSNVVRISQDTTGVPGTSEKGDKFGTRVRLADYNLNGKADLVVTAWGENAASGALWQMLGTSTGPKTSTAKVWGADAYGLAAHSGFGYSLLD